jgi:hypothetical protein
MVNRESTIGKQGQEKSDLPVPLSWIPNADVELL